MGVRLDLHWRKKVQLPWKRVLNFFPILRKGGKGRAKEKVLEVKKVMEEKEKEEEMVVVRKVAREKVKEKVPEKEKEREKESQEPWLSSWIDKEKEKEKEKEERGKEALVERGKEKEAPVEREKEEREVKEVIPTAQVKCHQLRISWPRHRILSQLRFVCSPPWVGLTVTW